MIQIAFETTGKNGSLAILDEESVLWQHNLGLQQRTAAELATQLNVAMQWCKGRGVGIEAVSVAIGPGSFTGLRIAVTTAKSLAYALQLPIVPVGSLAAIALATECRDSETSVLVGLNAFRKQVFCAEFSRQELDASTTSDVVDWNHRAEVVSRSEWDQRLADAIRSPQWAVFADRSIVDDLSVKRLSHRAHQDAVGVGLIAARLIAKYPMAADLDQSIEAADSARAGKPDGQKIYEDAFSLTARYLKASSAEEQASSAEEQANSR